MVGRTRYEYVERDLSLSGTTGTYTTDLPRSGYVPRLSIGVAATLNASTALALPVADAVSKIEIVDGGTVIKSLSGRQAQGLHMIRSGSDFASPATNANGAVSKDIFTVDMGGVFGGAEYAPNMSEFANPQLKVTWDFTATTTDRGMTVQAAASPAATLTVLAEIYEGEGKYTHGYVQSQDIYSYSSAASSTKDVDIPNKGKLVGLGVQAGYASKNLSDDIDRLKINFDNGAWVPLDLYADEITAFLASKEKSRYTTSFGADVIDGSIIDTGMGIVENVVLTPTAAAGRSAIWSGGSEGVGVLHLTDVATPTAISAYEQVKVKATGYAPQGIVYVGMSDLLAKGIDVLDASEFSKITMSITAGSGASSSSTPSVLTDYLVTA